MKSRRDIILLSLGLPIMFLAWLGFNYFSRDELDTQLRALAGPDAIDCGVMARGVIDSAAVQNCAVQSFDKKRPFYYRAALTPVPNQTPRSVGTVTTPKNEMFLLTAQEATWDNWLGTVTGKVQLFNPRLAVAANGTPTITFNRAPKNDKKAGATATPVATPATAPISTPTAKPAASPTSSTQRG